jgi:formylglycine-generating enzyme required for sulfatase activity
MPIPCNHACRRLTLPLLAIAAALLCANGVSAQDAEGSKLPGFSDTPPKSGPVIETDRGYMIPYKATIPGTTVTFEMIPIPCGVFKLGSPDGEKGRAKNEGPQVEIEVAPFWMGKHEVSWNEYERYMEQYRSYRTLRDVREVLAFDEKTLAISDSKKETRDRLKPLFDKARADEKALAAMTRDERKSIATLLMFARQKDAVAKVLAKPEFADLAKQLQKPVEHSDADAVTAPTQLYDLPTVYQDVTDKQQPATMMTHFAARQYTKWLSKMSGNVYRLPCEAEWEYACRAGTTTAYSFGDAQEKLGDHGWSYENSDDRTHVVGKKRANAWGLFDMHGNVGEWVLDEFVEDHYAKLAARGKSPLKAWETVAWPTKLYPRVVRGGGWDSDPPQCRSAARAGSHDVDWSASDPFQPTSPWWFSEDAARAVGFRLVRPLDAPSDADLKKCWDADVTEMIEEVTDRIKFQLRGEAEFVGPQLPEILKQAKALDEELEKIHDNLSDAMYD